jgi:hypothetical protein
MHVPGSTPVFAPTFKATSLRPGKVNTKCLLSFVLFAPRNASGVMLCGSSLSLQVVQNHTAKD